MVESHCSGLRVCPCLWEGAPNQSIQYEVSSRRGNYPSSVFTAAPHRLHCCLSSTFWAPPPVRSAETLDSHRSTNPAVNCACEGPRLHAPYRNLTPDDLRWSWSCDASAGEKLKIQIFISWEVWLHRDHNKSMACRLISEPYQWVASDN